MIFKIDESRRKLTLVDEGVRKQLLDILKRVNSCVGLGKLTQEYEDGGFLNQAKSIQVLRYLLEEFFTLPIMFWDEIIKGLFCLSFQKDLIFEYEIIKVRSLLERKFILAT